MELERYGRLTCNKLRASSHEPVFTARFAAPTSMNIVSLELHWLPVEQRITYKLAVLTYKTRQTSVSEYLSRHMTTRSSTRSLRSSSAQLLHVPFRQISFGKRSFSTAAPSVWNSLPVSDQNCDTLTLFKSRLKAHMFSSVYAS